MISIPICNTWNSHHPRAVLNLFVDLSRREMEAWLFQEEFFDKFTQELIELSLVVGSQADRTLDEQCIYAAGSLLRNKERHADVAGYAQFFAQQVKEQLDADAVAVFMVNALLNRLDWKASVPHETLWASGTDASERFYAATDDRYSVKAWQEKEMYFLSTEDSVARRYEGIPKKSWELVQDPDRDDCLYGPIICARTGEVLGVVRCTNRSAGCLMFHDDDAAVLDSLIQAAAPIMEMLAAEESRIKALGKLTHEMQTPVVTIRGAVQLMRRHLRRKGIASVGLFPQDYLGDIWQWSDILGRLIQNADVLRTTYDGSIQLNCQPTLLLRDVIAPAVNQVGPLLAERGFSSHAIRYQFFEDIPELWIDRNQFLQVIFNLLANAIKYADSRIGFRVVLDGAFLNQRFLIRCSDYGPGIEEKYRERVFEQGFRTPDAARLNVAGQGLGLSVVKAIVAAHDGSVRLASCKDPTMFEISLPQYLREGPPLLLSKKHT